MLHIIQGLPFIIIIIVINDEGLCFEEAFIFVYFPIKIFLMTSPIYLFIYLLFVILSKLLTIITVNQGDLPISLKPIVLVFSIFYPILLNISSIQLAQVKFTIIIVISIITKAFDDFICGYVYDGVAILGTQKHFTPQNLNFSCHFFSLIQCFTILKYHRLE